MLNGCNPLLGTTGAAGAAPITLFDFPKPTPEEPSSSGRKKEKGHSCCFCSITSTPAGDDPEEGEAEHEPEPEARPSVTITHDGQLKKAENQCFCGKGDFKTTEELNKHKQDVHIQKGSAKNPKTGKPFDSWDCSQCREKCSDNRACWKHFRTQHLGLYIHYCPVPGCGEGNDQKDTIVSHIKKSTRTKRNLLPFVINKHS